MPINFTINRAVLQDNLRLNDEQMEELFNNDSQYIYKHMNNGSGICPECAPWLGMGTTGDYSDGVPVPPLHPRCKCFLMPTSVAIISDILRGLNLRADIDLWNDHFEWLRGLSKDRLAAVVGKARASIVLRGELDIEDLYEGQHLRRLDELGYAGNGEKLATLIQVDDVLASVVVRNTMVDFHRTHWKSLPRSARGLSPGDYEGVRQMVAMALPRLRSTIRRPHWLALLLGLLRELLPGDAAESR